MSRAQAKIENRSAASVLDQLQRLGPWRWLVVDCTGCSPRSAREEMYWVARRRGVRITTLMLGEPYLAVSLRSRDLAACDTTTWEQRHERQD